MQYKASEKLARYRQQIANLRGKMHELRESVELEEVSDYEFSTTEGKVRPSELFGDEEYLFVIHNMGAGCRNCTLWADGFNGILPHIRIAPPFLSSRRTSPRHCRSSGPRVAGVSAWCRTAISALPVTWATGTTRAGYQGYRFSANAVERSTEPGDDFCAIWHFFDLLPQGTNGWQPQYAYH